jgi:hypothetical protein
MAMMMPQSADFFHVWEKLVAQASACGFWFALRTNPQAEARATGAFSVSAARFKAW